MDCKPSYGGGVGRHRSACASFVSTAVVAFALRVSTVLRQVGHGLPTFAWWRIRLLHTTFALCFHCGRGEASSVAPCVFCRLCSAVRQCLCLACFRCAPWLKHCLCLVCFHCAPWLKHCICLAVQLTADRDATQSELRTLRQSHEQVSQCWTLGKWLSQIMLRVGTGTSGGVSVSSNRVEFTISRASHLHHLASLATLNPMSSARVE